MVMLLLWNMAFASSVIHQRSPEPDGSFTSIAITGSPVKHHSYHTEAVNLIWSGVLQGGSLQACMPFPWTIPAGVTEVQGSDEDPSSTSGRFCKRLFFLMESGFAHLEPAFGRVAVTETEVSLSKADFQGIIAVEQVTHKAPENLYHPIITLMENDTGYTHSLPGSKVPLIQSGLFYGGEAYPPYDRKKPPVVPFRGPGSEITLMLVTNAAPWSTSENRGCRVEMLSASGETSVLNLPLYEIQQLNDFGVLTNPSRFVGYLRQRGNRLNSWFDVRNTLEQVLDRQDGTTDPDFYEAYIGNLIAELDELEVMITPDQPVNGGIPVSGIWGAMINGDTTSESDLQPAANQQSAGQNELRQRRSTQQSRENSDSPGDGNEAPDPSDHSAIVMAAETEQLDIRNILHQCDFSRQFSQQPDHYLAGLFGYGQLTFEQLCALFHYNPTSHSLGLQEAITSEALIDMLEQGDNYHRARTLSVLHEIDDDTPVTNGVVNFAPGIWKSTIQAKPVMLLESDSAPSAQRGRQLLLALLDNTSPALFNRLARGGFIRTQWLHQSPVSRYPLILLTLENHGCSRLEEIIEIVSGINPGLGSSLGNPSPDNSPEYSAVSENQLSSPVAGLSLDEKKARLIKELIIHHHIDDKTVKALSTAGLLNEEEIAKVFNNEDNIIPEQRICLLHELHRRTHILSNAERAELALKAFGYSEMAIQALKANNYLNPHSCRSLAQSFDAAADPASASAALQCVPLIRRYNRFLGTQNISFPSLYARMRTPEGWEQWNEEHWQLQDMILLNHKKLNNYVRLLADSLYEQSLSKGANEIVWTTKDTIEVWDRIKGLGNTHVQHFELFTGERIESTLFDAVKAGAIKQAKALLCRT